MRPRVLSDFEGRWRLSREISHADGQRATFTGLAAWQPDANGLIYSETGRLVMPGQQPMTAERRYAWREGLKVYFEDGRFFHQVPGEGGAARHWCDPDQYDVNYDFSAWPQWNCQWHVRGPRKSYQMTSRYDPL